MKAIDYLTMMNKGRIIGFAVVAVFIGLLLSACESAGAGGNGIEDDSGNGGNGEQFEEIVIAVDQDNWVSPAGGVTPPGVQSFVPQQTTLAGVDVRLGGSGSTLTSDIEISVYSNWDSNGGVSGQLASGRVFDVDRDTAAEVRWSPVTVTPGTTYYIRVIRLAGDQTISTRGGSYTFEGEGPNPGMIFRTYYVANTSD